MNICPTCGHESPSTARFCMECGAPLQPTPFVQERKVITALICVRSCLGAQAVDLAHRAFAVGTPPSPWNDAKIGAAQAMLEEADEECAAARDRFEAAAAGFHGFGDVHEEAHALAGFGRCLVALGFPTKARRPLAAAREIFETLGAGPDARRSTNCARARATACPCARAAR